jgi:hypothetical protein
LLPFFPIVFPSVIISPEFFISLLPFHHAFLSVFLLFQVFTPFLSCCPSVFVLRIVCLSLRFHLLPFIVMFVFLSVCYIVLCIPCDRNI